MSKAPTSRRPAPLSLRLTPEERLQLERDAAGLSLAAYIKSRLFDGLAGPVRSRGKFPVRDHQAISTVLGKLGHSRIANNLNQIARAANVGALDVTPEIEAELREAAAEVIAIRQLLVEALGLNGGSP